MGEARSSGGCDLGRLASEVGWKHCDLIKRMEAKRVVQSDAYYAKQKAAVALQAKAAAAADLSKVLPVLEAGGHALPKSA